MCVCVCVVAAYVSRAPRGPPWATGRLRGPWRREPAVEPARRAASACVRYTQPTRDGRSKHRRTAAVHRERAEPPSRRRARARRGGARAARAPAPPRPGESRESASPP